MEQRECKTCAGAPNLSLNLNPSQAAATSFASGMGRAQLSQRPHSVQFGKSHAIVQKDYYRHMKSDKIVGKHLEKKKAKELGRAASKSLLDIKKTRYQPIG